MANILERVNFPEDLKKLTYPELEKLAQEIREEIIRTISLNGGHLASSLGVVELTIALHRVFQTPRDRIIWDVGHQCYTHKLLTGRKGRFSTIRQYEGLSGFPVREESPYDVFNTGHAGTSISAALGIALARDLAGENFQVVSVIGDGSLGTGMAFEAINHAGHLGKKLIVILNDNGMAISPTRGAMARLLNQVRIDARYEMAKHKARRLFGHLPFGLRAWGLGKRAKASVERVFLPNAFWEQMGFIYLGPLDGHDIRAVEGALIRARDFESQPVIIHVLTTKGKGYAAAEDNAVQFHGLLPRVKVKDNGTSSYSQVFGRTMKRLMAENPRIVAITAAMVDGTGLAEAAKDFPNRVFDVGICEQHAVTLAAGLATQGYIPVVAIYSTFLQRAYDQIIHDVCLQNLPVVFAVDRAGIVGEDGATHQGAFDISYLLSIPNLTVSAPKDENELQHLLYTSIMSNRPAALRYPRGFGEGVTLDPAPRLLPLGQGELLKSGSDLTILALGSMVYPSAQAVELLEKNGIGCSLVNARFAKPLDSDLILSQIKQCQRLVTVEENVVKGGFGSAVLQLLAASRIESLKIECIGLPDRFVSHGKVEVLRSKYDLDPAGIVRRVKLSFPEISLANRSF